MASDAHSLGRTQPPPFVRPFLHALNRMRARETLQPEQLMRRAMALLDERLGTSTCAAEATFAFGNVGLMSEHTHYFDGFALLMPLAYGTAVAVRRTEAGSSQVVFEGDPAQWSFDRTDDDPGPAEEDTWGCLAKAIVRCFAPEDAQVEMAVVSTVPGACREGYWAALSIASERALQALFAFPVDPPVMVQQVRTLVAACEQRPFSLAYPMAADAGLPGKLVLADTDALEQLPLDAPAHDQLGWGLVTVGSDSMREPGFYRKMKGKADRVLRLLQQSGLEQLTSLRELDHQDLQRAAELLPPWYRSTLHYLVTENQRVQKLVAAVRRRDHQMLGALLLMSHAAQRSDWQSTSAETDFVVQQVEAMSLEGMYGASQVGSGGGVLVAGQPFTVPQCLDRIKVAFEERFGRPPETTLL